MPGASWSPSSRTATPARAISGTSSCDAFNDADVLVLTEIYAAGEDKIPGVEAAPLADAVRAHGHRDVRFAPDLERVLESLLELAAPGDLVVTLGAGSISALGARAARAPSGAAS